jgi:cysteinyl-tRNA synthetase
MAVKIYNTLAGKKEPFRPLKNKSVRMYVCGVTVYDRCHLGHARSAIVFDMIRRYLRFRRYKVRYVRNFTDVDDKIIQRANREGRPWTEIVQKYLAAYQEDMKRLGVEKPDREPRATEHIPNMIRLIERLVRRGFAYSVDGDVYYRVEKFKGYGKLAKRKSDELLAGARVEVDERKKSPLDFALWKAAKPGEPFWDTPWGPGRPGWHIECSAMSMKLLGESFDIHGGGMDLIFPHHENEIAQSEAATRRPFVRYWVHNGFVNVNQEKMSKSLGNFFTIQEIFEKSNWPETVTAEVLRYFLLSTHYRSPIDFSDEALKAAKAGLNNFYILFQKLDEVKAMKGTRDAQLEKSLKAFASSFEKAMDDDFNTAGAIAQLQKLRNEVNRALDLGLSAKTASKAKETILKYGAVLALLRVPLKEWRHEYVLNAEPGEYQVTGVPAKLSVSFNDETVNKLVVERAEARRRNDWARADAIRKQLADSGVILEDRPDGTTRWRR